jgi:hypothetical protein
MKKNPINLYYCLSDNISLRENVAFCWKVVFCRRKQPLFSQDYADASLDGFSLSRIFRLASKLACPM